ncbi:MAG: lamin tail domain-containing protein [Ignavibacteriaceae bacterium]
MNKLSFLLVSFLLINSSIFSQVANHVVIAEVYGGGGNTGAYYKYDYIVLYNPTSSPVDLSSWTIQYATAADTGTGWRPTYLSGSIQSNSYYLIQERVGTKGGVDLPLTPNVIDSIGLSYTGGKVALVSSLDTLKVKNPNGVTNVIDLLGYGDTSKVKGFETVPMSAPINATQSLRRKDNSGNNTYGTNGSGWDTDTNSTNFYKQVVDSTNPPLPVELSLFTASTIENKYVNLYWQTQTETNNYGFEIQRLNHSQNNLNNWGTIGFVSGNGNSNSVQSYSFIDNEISSSGKYSYRLKQIDHDGSYTFSSALNIELKTPGKFDLLQNYPNPFNPSTVIEYNIPEECFVDIDVFDSQGIKVADLLTKKHSAGNYKIQFDGSGLASGVYIYKLKASSTNQNYSLSKKMILLR